MGRPDPSPGKDLRGEKTDRYTVIVTGAKSLQKIMKLVLVKLTVEVLSMQISKHAYICG